jgi:hypothetical protein
LLVTEPSRRRCRPPEIVIRATDTEGTTNVEPMSQDGPPLPTEEEPQRLYRVVYLRGRGDKKLQATMPLDAGTPVVDALAAHLRVRPGVLRVLEFVEVDEAGAEVAGEPTTEPPEELDPLAAELIAAVDDSREKTAAAAKARKRERELRQRRDNLIRQLAPTTTGLALSRRFGLSEASISRIVSAEPDQDDESSEEN